MEKFILRSFLTICALGFLSLAACSSGEVADITGLDNYSTVLNNFSQADQDTLVGSGRVRFNTHLPGATSRRSIALKAFLEHQSSSVSAVLYSNNHQVPSSDGVVVSFFRVGASITGTITVNGTTSDIDDDALVFFHPSLDVIIDVHNDGNKTRVLIWRRNVGAYAASSADVDTSVPGEVTPPIGNNNRGSGMYAGLIVSQATVTAAQLSLAKVLD